MCTVYSQSSQGTDTQPDQILNQVSDLEIYYEPDSEIMEQISDPDPKTDTEN